MDKGQSFRSQMQFLFGFGADKRLLMFMFLQQGDRGCGAMHPSTQQLTAVHFLAQP